MLHYSSKEVITIEKYDCFCGTVVGGNAQGIYVRADNGEMVFAYYGNLPFGSRVMCSFLYQSKKKKYPRCIVDAVITYGENAA